jgi:hypothetical protein
VPKSEDGESLRKRCDKVDYGSLELAYTVRELIAEQAATDRLPDFLYEELTETLGLKLPAGSSYARATRVLRDAYRDRDDG